jgi:WD40 repeat protein/predicted Ser/Thr protein kinase
MALLWKCRQGHETDSLVAPPACPVCGETVAADRNGDTPPIPTTIDFAASKPEMPKTILDFKPIIDAGAARAAEPSLNLKVEVPGYEILGELGRGGMGVVYKAKQRGLNRVVALKMILTAEHAGPAERARFQVEAEAVAQLQHSNIVQIYDVGEVDGRPYFSLEFVDGGSLAQKLDGKPQPPRQAAALVEALARAVAAAHGLGIVHRDLKPANVLLANTVVESGSLKSLSSLALRAQHPYGIPKITDFGLAKRLEGGSGQTQSGSILGTPAYMSPEQAAGNAKEVGPHSDVYSLGAILYELLTGRQPFVADTPFDIIMAVIRDEPVGPRTVQPKMPRDLEVICLKCLEKRPEKRYATAAELADDLRRYLDGETISARAATRPERAVKWVRRHPATSGFIALGMVALSAMIVGAWVYHNRVKDKAAEAEAERDKLAAEKQTTLRQTIHLMVANGTQHVNQGDYLRALPWFTEALRLEGRHTDANQEMHRVRLAATLRQCPRLTRAWFHEGRVNDAAFSPDNTRIVTACADGSARVFSVAALDDGPPLFELKHAGPVLWARFSPTGKHIFTAAADNTGQIWDAATGAAIGEPLGHQGPVTGGVFTPDGLRILTTSADRTARIWDVPSGEGTSIIFKHAGAVNHADFRFDGKWVVTAGADGSARVWDTDTGKPVSPVLAHQGPVVAVYFSPDGKRVLSASQDQTARVWDAQTGAGVTPFIRRSTPLTDAAYSPTGRDIVTASTDGTGRVWNLDINDWRTHVIRHDSPIADIAFGPDGRTLASGGADNTARVWDVAHGEPLTPPLRHNGTVYRVVFSADGRSLLTASQDGLVRLWDVAAARRPSVAEMGMGAIAVAQRTLYSPDRRRLLRFGGDGKAQVLDAGSGEPIGVLMKHRAAIVAATFSPDGGRVLTASADRTARVWSATTGEPIGSAMSHGSDVNCAAFSPDGKRIVTGSDDNTARVWDTESGEPVTPPLKHFATVDRAVFSPDGRCVLTTALDGLARLWDASTGEALAPPAKPAGWVQHVLESGDAGGGWDLPPDQRAVERLGLLAQWLSTHRIDASGNLVPLEVAQLHEIWRQLRANYPAEFADADDGPAWHRHEAETAEKAREWFGAVFHLTRLIDSCPEKCDRKSRAALFVRRGRAFAEQEMWMPAAANFQQALKDGLDDEALFTAHALARLAGGDITGYRMACAQIIELCDESANGDSACRLAWVCLLCPDAAKLNRALDELHALTEVERPSALCLLVRGASQARAGKWEAAAATLSTSQVFAEGIDAVRGWLFLALAEHHNRHADESKRWLRQARIWLDRNNAIDPKTLGSKAPALSWQQRLELKLLFAEVEKTLAGPVEDDGRIEKIK